MTYTFPNPPTLRHQTEKRVARCLRILSLINREPCHWSRSDLAAHFAIGEREIDRDLEVLRAVGYVIARRKGGYEVEVDAGLPEPPAEICPSLTP